MKILFIGDIFGRAGRETVGKILPEMKKKYSPDIVIANPENMSHGTGFSLKNIEEMQKAGVDFFTSGNHVWSNPDGVAHLDEKDFPVLRPANFPSKDTPGRGHRIVETKGKKILIISLIGQVFMKQNVDSPFKVIDQILEENREQDLSAIFVDFHAETTSEKTALAFYLDGRVSAVVGTHTHIQTNDARVLENGTAYITDVGMTGPQDSVIGVKKEIIIKKFLTQMPVKNTPETEGKMIFNAVFIEVDEETKKALNISNVFEYAN